MKCSIIITIGIILALTHNTQCRPHKHHRRHRHAAIVASKKTKLYERPNGEGRLEPQLTAGDDYKESKTHQRELLSCTDAACMEEKGNKLEEYVLSKLKSNIQHLDVDRPKRPPLTEEEREALKHGSINTTTKVTNEQNEENNYQTFDKIKEIMASKNNSTTSKTSANIDNKLETKKEGFAPSGNTDKDSSTVLEKNDKLPNEKEQNATTSESKIDKDSSKYKKLVNEVSKSDDNLVKDSKEHSDNKGDNNNKNNSTQSTSEIFSEKEKNKRIIEKLVANRRKKEKEILSGDKTTKNGEKEKKETTPLKLHHNPSKKDATKPTPQEQGVNRFDKEAEAYDQPDEKQTARGASEDNENDGYDFVKNAKGNAEKLDDQATSNSSTPQIKSDCTNSSCTLQAPMEKQNETSIKEEEKKMEEGGINKDAKEQKNEGELTDTDQDTSIKKKKKDGKDPVIEQVSKEDNDGENNNLNKSDDENNKEEDTTECTDESCSIQAQGKDSDEMDKNENSESSLNDDPNDAEEIIANDEEREITKELKDVTKEEEHEVKIEEEVASHLAAKAQKVAEEEKAMAESKMMEEEENNILSKGRGLTEVKHENNTHTKSECTDDVCSVSLNPEEHKGEHENSSHQDDKTEESEAELLSNEKIDAKKQNDSTNGDVEEDGVGTELNSDEADTKSKCTGHVCTLNATSSTEEEKEVSDKEHDGFKVISKGKKNDDKKPEENMKTLTKESEKEHNTEKEVKKEQSQTKSECTDAACGIEHLKEESKSTKDKKSYDAEKEEEIKDKKFAESIQDQVARYNKTEQRTHQKLNNPDKETKNTTADAKETMATSADAKETKSTSAEAKEIKNTTTDAKETMATSADAKETPANVQDPSTSADAYGIVPENEDNLFTIHNENESDPPVTGKKVQQQGFAKTKDTEYPISEDENNMKYEYGFNSNYIL